MDEQILNTPEALEHFINELRQLWLEKRYLRVDVKTGRQRSSQQNRALHLWLTWVMQGLNDAGLDQVLVLEALNADDCTVPWTEIAVKNRLWRPVQVALIDEESTRDAERQDYSRIEQVLAHKLAQATGYQCPPWPNIKDKEKRDDDRSS